MSDSRTVTIAAHNAAQAEYVVRSRAQQRGVTLEGLDVTAAGSGTFAVTVTVPDADDARLVAAALDEDTQVLHLRAHPRRPPNG